MSKNKIIQASGRRKTAVARAILKEGKGRLIINNKPIDLFEPELYALRIKEPLILAGKIADKVDIKIKVQGGGFSSQTDAIRVAIANAMIKYKDSLKDLYLDYDRPMVVSDARTKEVTKPNTQGSARSKRQKSYR